MLHRWREITGHTLLERYGMTEIGMGLRQSAPGRAPAGPGLPFPGVEVRLAERGGHPPSTTARRANSRSAAPPSSSEYRRWPAETRGAFRPRLVPHRLHRRARRRHATPAARPRQVDIIKTGGFKVSALEIERSLREHAAIAACAVVGMPSDPEWGERVAAAVELRTGASLALPELQEWSRARLAPYKIPRDLVIVTALPQNVMGEDDQGRSATTVSRARQLLLHITAA